MMEATAPPGKPGIQHWTTLPFYLGSDSFISSTHEPKWTINTQVPLQVLPVGLNIEIEHSGLGLSELDVAKK